MALAKNLTLTDNFGEEILFENAYIRVDQIKGGKNGLVILVQSYKKDQSSIIKTEECVFAPELDGNNFIKQAYNYLKTLPKFADAVDC